MGWKEWPYWLKGGIIALVIFSLIHLINSQNFLGFLIVLTGPINILISIIFAPIMLLLDYLGLPWSRLWESHAWDGATNLGFIIFLPLGFIIGVLIGLIVGKKNEK